MAKIQVVPVPQDSHAQIGRVLIADSEILMRAEIDPEHSEFSIEWPSDTALVQVVRGFVHFVFSQSLSEELLTVSGPHWAAFSPGEALGRVEQPFSRRDIAQIHEWVRMLRDAAGADISHISDGNWIAELEFAEEERVSRLALAADATLNSFTLWNIASGSHVNPHMAYMAPWEFGVHFKDLVSPVEPKLDQQPMSSPWA